MPTHKWRPRPLHPCNNTLCGILHTRPGQYCAKCHKRWLRHGTFILEPRVKSICVTPACRSFVKAFDRCHRCHELWKKGINPETFHRPYRRLCSVIWCPEYSWGDGMCNKHAQRFRNHGDARICRGVLEPIPTRCTWTDCHQPIYKRGLCLDHLKEKSVEIILLREFLPTLAGHAKRYCIGKPKCKRNAILFGRCPDCLYDWQWSLRPPRNFFKTSA